MNAKILGIFTLLLVLCVYLALAVPESFLTGNNIENLLRRTALYGVLGIGVAFVIITGGIDLSIGSVVVLCACLLAIFLQVDYGPRDEHRVLAIYGAQRQVVLAGTVESLKPGDRVRFYGSRRAHNVLATATQITPHRFEFNGRGLDATAVTVDEPLNERDILADLEAREYVGSLTKVYPLGAFDPGGPTHPPTLTIPGEHPLEARDQVTLVHPKGGVKQLPIVAAEAQGGQTVLSLASHPGGDFNTEWLAIPVERRQRMPVVAGIAAVLGVGLLLGLLHGLLITKLDLQPFVVTLCGLLFYRGITRWLVSDRPPGFGNEYQDSLTALVQGKWEIYERFGIPYPFLILVVVALIAAVFLTKTIWGRYMLALGRNEEATRFSGVNTDRMTILAYVICTGLAALGGMLFAVDANSISPSSFGTFFELYAIAAAVLGGCSLRGGEGSIIGVVIGTAVMQTLYTLIVQLKISDKLEFAIIGAVLLIGVIADELVKRYAARRRAIRTAAAPAP